MRNFIITTGIFFFLFSSVYAQTTEFEKEWLEIENLEIDGKIKSALEKVNTLNTKAIRKKNNIQQLKTLLFRWKFLQIIDEKSQVKILEELQAEIKKQEFPNKQLLHMYMASFLESYLNDYYWKISKRTTTEKAEFRNYQTWDQTTFLNQISKHYETALKPYLNLTSIPTEKISELLITVPIHRKYKPTVYDIIAHKALGFYKNTRSRVHKPKDEFLIDKETFFETSSTFIKQRISTTDNTSLLYKALKTYQQLEAIHSQQKNNAAWATNSLKRLQFVKNNYTGVDTGSKYIAGLQNLLSDFNQNKEISKIQLELAKAYRDIAFDKDSKGSYKHPDYNQKALQLIAKIEENKDDVQTLIEAKNLKDKILRHQLTWLTQNKYLPNKPHLAKITYTNAQKATVTAYKVPHTYNYEKLRYNERDSLIKAYVSKRKFAFMKTYLLPQKENFNSYSTEVIVPKLPLGNYIFRIQTDTLSDSFKYHQLKVTELSINKTNKATKTKYQVLNRYSGKPISNASIVLKAKINRKNNPYKTTNYTTNKWGEFNHHLKNRYQNNTITIRTAVDTLTLGDYSRRNNNKSSNENTKTKILLFLDRAIYRPGQKVYYKAVAISKIKGKTSIISNQKINLEFDDANDDTFFEETQMTNEYGSISGSFTLPKTGVTGEFIGYAYLNEDGSNKIDSNNEEAEIYFSVEEYKRPTFEVAFLPSTRIYKPLDSVKIKGNAKAYLGSSITEATVAYSVKRTTQYRYWWLRRGNSENKQITSGTVKTNNKGEFTIPFKAETDEEDIKDKIYTYTIEAKITDLNGETRENTTTIKVANKNLIATINTSENWNAKSPPPLSIASTDVNGNPIKTNGTLKIYKLQSPGRFLNTRPWPTPNIQQIPETTFKENFPHIPFTNEKDSKNWKKGELIFEDTYTHKKQHDIKIENFKKWPAGKYVIETKIADPETKATTENQKTIILQQPNQNFPADEQIFIHETNYTKSNPDKIELKLQTAVPNLVVFTEIFDGDKLIWKEKIALNKESKKVTIKLPKLRYPKVTATYKYQIFDAFYTAKDHFDFTPEPVILKIEKKHFTDKLYPSQKETWSFNIQSSNKKAFSAEALASMYDASLDTFKKSSWNANFGFGKSYPSPSLAKSITNIHTKSINYRSPIFNLSKPNTPNEHLDYFGFEFKKVNTWKYKKYINALRVKNILSNSKNYKKIIQGVVKTEVRNLNLPIPGVTIKIKGSTVTTTSDFDGKYIIEARKGDTLQFISVGYNLKNIVVSDNNIINVKIREYDTIIPEDIAVKGYGKSKKRRSKGSLSAVSVRGISSLSGNLKGPSYVIDGIPVEDIGNINPLNIDTIEVLEDAAPGTSGVIAITTKNGVDLKKLNLKPINNLQNIQTRKNLKETAFFLPNLRTNAKGAIEFEFTAPEALTRWNFRMLAHTKEAVTGKLNAQTLTQKDLSIIPNAPRFVREGDQLRFTAKVVNLTSEKMTGTALLEWTDPTTGNSVNQLLKHTQQTQSFSIDANGNNVLSWNITIPEEGLPAIQYKIVASANNFTDGEEKIIPVLSNRMLVTESIPLWVRAGETESFSLTNFAPKSTTQKPHQITLEYTSNPAWMAIKSLPYLMEFPHECSEQTFSRLYANTMAAHILNSQPKIKSVFDSWKAKGTLESPLEKNEELKTILLSESPWLQEAQSETEQQKRLATLFDLEKTAQAQQRSINKLRQLQKSNGGFPWFQGGNANTYITRHIVAGFGHLEKLGVTKQHSKTNLIIKNAIRFLDDDLIYTYNNYLKYHKTADGFYKQVRLLHFAYARSFYKNRFPLKGKTKEIIEKALDFQKSDWQSRSIYEKGLLALALHRFEKSPTTKKIVTALTESAVHSKENGMYWKKNTNSWWWYRSEISTQALLIEAFSEIKQPKKDIEEMKIFLLKNKRTNRWNTTITTANATYALLLQGNDWLSVKDNTIIETGGTTISTKKLSETEKEQGTGYLKTSWKANEITPNFKTLKITNKSTTTGYGGYYWQYFENLDRIKTDDKNPLSIDKELYKKITSDKGTELKRITPETPLTIGDKVTVRLIIKSDDTLEFVHLKDMRASGFEPTKVLSGYEYKDNLGYYQSTKDVASHFFIDKLPKGSYVLEYDVIANQGGSFSNGITSLQCMYAPEYSSHSAGQRVKIIK